MRLDTTRLVLRDLRPTDVAAVHAYAANPMVSAYQDWGPNDEAATRAWLDAAIAAAGGQPRVAWTLAVTERGTDDHAVGAVSLRLNLQNRSGMMGFVLHPSRWGLGYATEGGHAILRFGFDDLGLHRIASTCRVANVASIRVIEKLGMHFEGHLREDCVVRGQYMDSRLYAKLASDA